MTRWHRVSLTGMLVALSLGAADPAAAHIDLVESFPDDGQRLRSAPTELVLTFNEKVAADYVTATATIAEGPRAELPAAVSGAVVRLDLVRVAETAANAGRGAEREVPPWEVSYRVLSLDGHPVQGAVGFSAPLPEERDDSAATSSSGQPQAPDAGREAASEVAAPEPARGLPMTTVLIALGALGVAGAGLSWWRARRA